MDCNSNDCLNCKLDKCVYDLKAEIKRNLIHGQADGLADRLRQALREKRLKQNEFAKLTGIPAVTLYQYTSGTRQPRLDYFVMICKTLDVSADWLLGLNTGD